MSSGTKKTKWVATPGTSKAAPSLTVNGSPFFAQGVCYQAVPWGGSANWTPFGDFMTDTWKTVWQRDLPVMRAGGVNLLRTYNMPKHQSGTRHHHAEALKACWNDGTDPIYVLMGVGVLNQVSMYDPWHKTNSDREAAKKAFHDTVDQYKDDPAVMGFIIGNEINTAGTIAETQFWTFMNDLAGYVQSNAPDKLSVMCLVDDSMASVKLGDSQMGNLDVWGINSYRGNDKKATNNFDSLWSSYQAQSEKPLLVSEWGAPASGRGKSGTMVFGTLVAAGLDTYITGHYTDILYNAVTTTSNGGSGNPNSANWAPVCIGSTYFEWSDELWKLDDSYPGKTCQATVQNMGIATNPNFPGGWDDEECFGLNAVTPAVTPANYYGPNDPSSSVKPEDRPGPGKHGAGCPGPWNFDQNAPYPPDDLTPRPSWTTLSGMFASN